MRKLYLLCVFLVYFGDHWCSAQIFQMSNSTVNTCSGFFYDSGGAGAGNGANYSNNENSTMTFCSSNPGTCVRLNFTNFSLENNYDFLRIYNGPNTASPLIGTYTGTANPGVVTGTSGCITLVFTSDAIITSSGWAAQISCVSCSNGSCNTSCNGGSPPANDPCSGAQNLGNLPAPQACPNGIGAFSVTNTTNLCATAEFPYSSLLGCQPSGNMASPASDVWYRFNITGPTLNINISGGLATPNVGLYQGNGCNNLIPRGCAIGAGGTLNTSFTGLAPGTYYLQVSGGSVTDQCTFTLSLQNNFDCAGCVIQSSLTANPPPSNGVYNAGQNVTFCYTISDFNQTSVNWLHGVIPSLGSGWDMSTFVPISATNCSGAGTWSWYNTNVTSSATGNTTGPGFYYESPIGSPSGVSDGNPGNNFGDNNGANLCDWTFCWSVSTLPTAQCVSGTSLNININTTGDGESGSWTSLACTQDPVTSFFATLNCCQPPNVSVINPTCPGVSNGSATVQGQGASPWDYIWRNSGGTILLNQANLNGASTLNGLAAGSYTVTVTDNTGCTSIANVTITAPTPFTALMNTTSLNCFGVNNGSANVIVNGGTPGYTYAWSPSGSGSNPVSLGPGNYTVTVTDANGCTTVANGVISQPAQILPSASSQTNVSCNGGQNGAITASASGGTGPYGYSWSNGSAGSSINGLSAGTYTFTVTDARGCTAVQSVSITEPAPVSLSLSSTSATCGSSNGSATVSASGGTPGYSYAWTPAGGSGTTASNLNAGGYSVTVTDSRGCTAIGNVVVSNTTGPTASITASTPVSCNGGSSGSATASVAGASGAVIYNWSPAGGSNATANNLPAGSYTVTVSDASGCTSSATIIITQPPVLTGAITSSIPTLCNNSADGSLTVQGNGGSPAYTYSWNNGSSSPSITNIPAGNYTVTVTDANGCTVLVNGNVSSPSTLTPSIGSTTPTSCAGASDGSISAAANGGTAPYSYQWSNGQSGTSANNLPAGTYTVTVTDGYGCTGSISGSVTEPAPLTISLSSTGSTCGTSNGSATVVANGGTGPYSYSWNPGGGNGATASNLPAGNYSVIVTDVSGCVAVGGVNIGTADAPGLAIANTTNASCNGGSNGSISLNVNGGTAPFILTWSNGQSGTSANNLPAGSYTVTVTDANNCTAVINTSISEPVPLAPNVQATDANCGQANGSLQITFSGGTAPYSYQWSNGSIAAGPLASLSAGSYTLTVTDANGCTASASGTVNDLPGPTLNPAASSNASCNGVSDGSISVSASGGAAPYSYQWSNGSNSNPITSIPAGSYSVTVTDANGCTALLQTSITEPTPIVAAGSSTDATCGATNGSASVAVNGGTAPYQYIWAGGNGSAASASGLGAGNYAVTITDNQGCTASANIIVNSANGPTVALTLSSDVDCNGGNDGSISISANGGTGPLSYQWTPAGGGLSSTGLAAGAYTITVTDANNCTSVVNVQINEPPALTLSLQPSTAHCGLSDGSISAVSGGGSAPYSYVWSTGTSSTTQLNTVAAGTYTITMTDANGCTVSAAAAVGNEAPPVVSTAPVVDVLCNGGSNGSIAINVNGGTSPYNYNWSNGTSGNGATGLSAGTYTVTVTDVNGCTGTTTATVSEPVAIQLSFSSTTASCGFANGSSTVSVNGGVAPFTYLWSDGSTGSTASALNSGSYIVTVTDANGCSVTDNAIVNSAGGPVLTSAGQTDISCSGSNNGSASVNVASGNGPFSYVWTPAGGNGTVANGLTAGNYAVTVTDVNGCTSVQAFTLSEPSPLLVNNTTTPVSCNGGNNGIAQINVQGGTGPYAYNWNPGGAGDSIQNSLTAGTYTVTVTDANGCTSVTNAAVAEPTILSAIVSSSDVSCAGGNDGQLNTLASGGTAPYTFLWTNGTGSAQASSLGAGSYTVTVTDNNGCTVSVNGSINEPPSITIAFTTTDAACGQSNGSITANVNGGTGAFTYLWSNGGSSGSATGLPAGTYTVTATDANGCSQTLSASVSDLPGHQVQVLSANPVSCAGNSDGTATVDPTGGAAPYTYQWQPTGGNGASASNLAAGSYTVIVTDNLGCTASVNVQINSPAAINVVLSGAPSTCNLPNGSASALVNGGSAPYNYQWSNGSTGATANGLATGNYVLTVTDNNGCTAQENIAITAPPALAALTFTTTVSCAAGNNGSASLNVSGGSAPYQYSWSNGGSSSSINNLTAGTFTVIITDNDGCSISQTLNVTEPPAITASTSVTDAICGAQNGSASVVPAGGSGNLSVIWSTGASAASINNLAAGTYTVTITDNSGCTTSAIAAVGNVGGPQVALQSSSDASCAGASDGAATVNVAGGTGPFTYLWQPAGGANPSASGLPAGNYTVAVTDANGCVSNVNVSIAEPSPVILQFSTAQASCGNANGSASVNPSGGTAPYSFLWSNGANVATAANIPAGSYDVTVTDDNGCIASGNAVVSQPGALLVQTNANPASCFGGNDGNASAIVNGGSAPYQYSWSNGGSSSSINNLTAGTYTVTVSDALGCTFSSQINIAQGAAINLQTSVVDASCGASNGSAYANASGGNGALSYSWSTGAGAASINNLAAGTYTVTITDNSGCTTSAIAAVGNVGGPQVALQSSSDASCAGASDGAATVNVAGGTGPFNYLWQPSGGSNPSASGLPAGNYTVAVTDANGCVSNVNVSIAEPSPVILQFSTAQASCGNANGSASVNPSGGTAPYSFLWSNGANVATATNIPAGSYDVTVTDDNGCTVTGIATVTDIGGPVIAINNVVNVPCFGGSGGGATVQVINGNGPFTYSWQPNGGTTAQASGLSAGSHTVSVTDVSGCVTQQAIVITEPSAITLQTSTTPSQCNASDGSANVVAGGGVGGYSYVWSSGALTAQATGLAAGSYTITITDANGCTTSENVSVANASGPSIQNVNTSDVSCNGATNGTAQVQVLSGTSPIVINWSNGATGTTVGGLAAGTYSVSVSDAIGCTANTTFTITEPSPVGLSLSNSGMVSCFGGNNGTIQVSGSGGTTPYSYQWSNGVTGPNLSGLIAGSYSVTVTDNNGCSLVQSYIITQPAQLQLASTGATMVSCFGGSDGTASWAVSGGTSPYQLNWTGGYSGTSVNNLPAGNYIVTVTDLSGCLVTGQVNITEPSALVLNTPVVTDVSCFNGNNGQVVTNVSGGTAPYQHQWSNGAQQSSIQNLPAGAYSLIITDANGCTQSTTVNVTQPAALGVQSGLTQILCNGQNNGAIVATATGGVSPYTYNWNNGASGSGIQSLSPGTYTVTITDGNSCSYSTSYTITQPAALSAQVSSPDTLCNGQSASLTVNVSGGSPGYSFLWNTGNTGNTVSVSPAASTSYSVVVTDTNGCSFSLNNIPVAVYPPLSLLLTVSDDTLCAGENTLLTALAGGGNGGPYTYLWSNTSGGNSLQNPNPDTTTTYEVSVSDGCTSIEPVAQQLVVVNPLPVPAFTPLRKEGCSPVTVQFLANGSTGALYSWIFGDGSTGAGLNPMHTYVESGEYDVSLQVIDANGCENSLTINNVIEVFPLPVAFFTTTPQEVSILNPVANFSNGSTGAVSALWDLGDGTSAINDWSPKHTYSDTGRYKVELIVESNEGCRDTFYNEIIVRGETTFWIPNGFSPNNDGTNETFTGYGIGIREAFFYIFDRWGKQVYESNSLDKGWDGSFGNNGDPCPEGVYVYLFKVYGLLEELPREHTGRVTLVR